MNLQFFIIFKLYNIFKYFKNIIFLYSIQYQNIRRAVSCQIETRKSRDTQYDIDNEEKIPYRHTFRFIKVKKYHQRKVYIHSIFSS